MWGLDDDGLPKWYPGSIEEIAPINDVYAPPRVETEKEKQERMWKAIQEFS